MADKIVATCYSISFKCKRIGRQKWIITHFHVKVVALTHIC